MLRSVDLAVALNTHLEQLVAAQVKVVVRLCHLGVGLLGVRGDRQSPTNILFFRLCSSLAIDGGGGAGRVYDVKNGPAFVSY